MIVVTPDICIPEREIILEFVRASGPGGQKINKTATAVQLRFDIASTSSLPEDVRQRLLRLAGKRVTDDGVLILNARRYRTQERNRQDAINRLIGIIRRASTPPRIRRRMKPPRRSRLERLEQKRRRSEKKRWRRPPRMDD